LMGTAGGSEPGLVRRLGDASAAAQQLGEAVNACMPQESAGADSNAATEHALEMARAVAGQLGQAVHVDIELVLGGGLQGRSEPFHLAVSLVHGRKHIATAPRAHSDF